MDRSSYKDLIYLLRERDKLCHLSLCRMRPTKNCLRYGFCTSTEVSLEVQIEEGKVWPYPQQSSSYPAWSQNYTEIVDEFVHKPPWYFRSLKHTSSVCYLPYWCCRREVVERGLAHKQGLWQPPDIHPAVEIEEQLQLPTGHQSEVRQTTKGK